MSEKKRKRGFDDGKEGRAPAELSSEYLEGFTEGRKEWERVRREKAWDDFEAPARGPYGTNPDDKNFIDRDHPEFFSFYSDFGPK